MSININIFLSLFGGVVPALLWLWFWLKEDRLHPEPKRLVIATFLVGMFSVILVLPIEKFIFSLLGHSVNVGTIFLWAFTEEMLKFLAVYIVALSSKDIDEPLDIVIYMITGALGFSALENSFFLWNILDSGLFAQGIITGNMRFLGATLLHIASSSILGILYALSFYMDTVSRKIYLFTGILISVVLHTAFNLLIIKSGEKIFFIFAGLWVIISIIIIMLEKIKRVHA
jgi:RsiW-degrading membrane proteinase PrsW (M82 family)